MGIDLGEKYGKLDWAEILLGLVRLVADPGNLEDVSLLPQACFVQMYPHLKHWFDCTTKSH